jgi:hypothetical protein
MALQFKVAFPETEMLLGLNAPQVSPLDGLPVRVIVPVKPFNGVTIIVAAVDEPTFAAGAEGADSLKSGCGIMTIIVAVRTIRPYVPVTLTRYVPWTILRADKVRIDEPVSTMKGILKTALRPGGGATVRSTVPINPLSAVT